MSAITSQPQSLLEAIVQSLQLLAADYETQVAALPDFAHVPDELALTFSDAFALADQIRKAGLLTDHQITLLRQIDQRLEQMSGDSAFWTLDQLRHSAAWQDVRLLAEHALAALSSQRQAPQSRSIRYVRGKPHASTDALASSEAEYSQKHQAKPLTAREKSDKAD